MSKTATNTFEPEGPGREALDTLYRFVAALELTPTVAVHSIDPNGLVRFWNHSCETIFGVPAREAIGRPLTSLVSHLDKETEFEDTLGGIWHTRRSPAPRDWHVRRLDGKELWTYSSHFPIMRDGEVQQVFCMEVDISQRKVDEQALLEAGANFRQLFERSHDAIVLIEGNAIVDANPAALQLFHVPDKDAILGKTLIDFSPVHQPSGDSSLMADASQSAQNFIEGNRRYEWEFKLADGTTFWSEILLTSVALDHQLLSYAVVRDISSRKTTESTLQMAAHVFENSRDAIAIADLDHRVLAVNHAFVHMTGIAATEVVGRELPQLQSDMHEPAFFQQIWDFVGNNTHWEGEVWSKIGNGQEQPLWVALTAIYDSAGTLSNYMVILSDMTDRKRIEEHTRHLAEHDFLTDLPNRVLFLDRLQQALATARRKGTKVAVMFVDLDRFKGINDSFGHHVGDTVLKEVASRLSGCVRNVDTVSRQGGDEFVVILSDIGGADQAAHVAGSVMQAVARPVQADARTISISVSIGISICPEDGEDIDTLLKHADVAMYHAKQSGRNAFSFFNEDMNARVTEKVQLENALRHALDQQEFELAYQPEIDMCSGLTVGVEALLRWRHPQRGLLLPHQFLDVAEECGLIVPIGNWVLREACERARSWHDAGLRVAVAVNLSAVQFTHDDLLGNVELALSESGLPPEMLDLEITEGVIMSGNPKAVATVTALRRRGIRLTIDDFGTGFSSLSYLRRFSLSKLKIDRSFVDDILKQPDDADMIAAIIAVARSLKLRVTAEGVETAAQLRFLRDHGCDEYQGHYAASAEAEPDLTRRHH
ncbi:bifunctional diguanylate cyclase/phosphodiesterase [Massilia sp. CF038]|uniref:sensor domain-containing protein n=1 Tax=Massilia sp. CF038 TaxID=1881045 RepID=UPI000918A9CB|nr:bifunctional diguanylate cyclase/phosphodiesterase [Massilia sp. CF038]SHG38422.1 PAS domain S-box-containing protein/diguanylate cyclase (GGDEF) domain-containing protein [Massilia sp. CF038]